MTSSTHTIATNAQVDPQVARQLASEPNLFTFNNTALRFIRDRSGEPWWKGKDVAVAMAYVGTAQAIRLNVKKEHRKKLKDLLCDTDTASKGDKEAWWINEAGCYDLILACQTPLGDAFRKWLSEDVLPTIRRTGGYQLSLATGSAEQEPDQATQHLQLCLMEQQLHQLTLQNRALAIETAEKAMNLAASARVPLTASQTEAVQRLLTRALLPPEQLDDATITVPEFLKLKGHRWDIPHIQGPMGRLAREKYRQAYGRDPPKIADTQGPMSFDCNCYDRQQDMLILEAAYRGLSLSDNYRAHVPLSTQIVNS